MTKKICGLFGSPVHHSLSPAMHQAAYTALGLSDWEYRLFDVPPGELPAYIQKIRDDGMPGVNITVPYKVDVIPLLDKLDPLAERIGAVNTVKNVDGVLTGYNTDAPGFYESLIADAGVPEGAHYNVLILGAGGAARALIHILIEKKLVKKIYIYDAAVEKSIALVDSIGAHSVIHFRVLTEMEEVVEACQLECQILINASGVGSSHHPDQSPLGEEAFSPLHWVYDLGYNPRETLFLVLAEKAGARVCNGLGMLVRQGALAFEIFTGKKAPIEVMWRAVG